MQKTSKEFSQVILHIDMITLKIYLIFQDAPQAPDEILGIQPISFDLQQQLRASPQNFEFNWN